MIFEYQFIQNAIIASILASIAAGIIGSYIVAKKISLISGSIAHASFGGLGLGYFLGINPLYGALSFSMISSLVISFFRKTGIDSLLTFLWSSGMAIGLMFIFMTKGYATDLFTFLFGNILLVSKSDIVFILIIDVIILTVVYLMHNAFLMSLFEEEYAIVRDIPVRWVYVALYSLIGLTIVATLRVVGIVLMIAILTIPPAIAKRRVKSLKRIMVYSMIIVLFSTLGGLAVSYYFNFPTGPVIVLILSVLYLI